MELKSTTPSLNSPSENGDDKEEEVAAITEPTVAQGGTNYVQSQDRRQSVTLGTKREVSQTAEQVLYLKEDKEKLGTNEMTILFKTTA
jgi:hypothetical protein